MRFFVLIFQNIHGDLPTNSDFESTVVCQTSIESGNDNSFEVPFKHATALEIWRKLVYVKCIEFDCMRTQVSAIA